MIKSQTLSKNVKSLITRSIASYYRAINDTRFSIIEVLTDLLLEQDDKTITLAKPMTINDNFNVREEVISIRYRESGGGLLFETITRRYNESQDKKSLSPDYLISTTALVEIYENVLNMVEN